MISEFFLNAIKGVINFLISLLPNLESVSLPAGFVSWFSDLLSACSYFLPINDFIVMLGIFIVVTNFEIIWKTILRLWDSLPFT